MSEMEVWINVDKYTGEPLAHWWNATEEDACHEAAFFARDRGQIGNPCPHCAPPERPNPWKNAVAVKCKITLDKPETFRY